MLPSRVTCCRHGRRAAVEVDVLPSRLAELDLSYNVIDDVMMTSCGGGGHPLRHLDLQHNVVASLSATSFVQLDQLEVLLLGYNRLSRLDPAWFRPLVALRWLSLAGNRVSNLPPDGFQAVLRGSKASLRVPKRPWGVQAVPEGSRPSLMVPGRP